MVWCPVGYIYGYTEYIYVSMQGCWSSTVTRGPLWGLTSWNQNTRYIVHWSTLCPHVRIVARSSHIRMQTGITALQTPCELKNLWNELNNMPFFRIFIFFGWRKSGFCAIIIYKTPLNAFVRTEQKWIRGCLRLCRSTLQVWYADHMYVNRPSVHMLY